MANRSEATNDSYICCFFLTSTSKSESAAYRLLGRDAAEQQYPRHDGVDSPDSGAQPAHPIVDHQLVVELCEASDGPHRFCRISPR